MYADATANRVRAPIVMGLVLGWAVIMVTFMSLMMAGHMIPLPEPTADGTKAIPGRQVMAALVQTTSNMPVSERWQMIHVLVAGCPCSSYTAQYLCARKPARDCQETVLILGGSPDWEAALGPAGFAVRHKDGDELLKETGIAGGPWLLIISPGGKIVYSGGYATQRPRPGVALNDLTLYQSARGNEPVKAYPAFGCSATPLTQGTFDPVAVCQSIR